MGNWREVLVTTVIAGPVACGFAQPHPITETSLEAMVLNADSVTVATLVDYALAPNAVTVIDATFSVDEVLKGDVPRTVKAPLNLGLTSYVGWEPGRSHMLLTFIGGRYAVLPLSERSLAVMRADFSILRDANRVIGAAKQTLGSAASGAKVETVRVWVPDGAAKSFRKVWPGVYLNVPVDARLERWAVASAKSKDAARRRDVADALGHLKSDRNITILKGMLDDPATAHYNLPAEKLGHGRRLYTVRQAARLLPSKS